MRKWINGCLAAVMLLGSFALPIGSTHTVHAAEASASDIAFEQANYGTLVASGNVENAVTGSSTTGANSSWGYSAGTYYKYSKSIEADVTIPAPNTIGAAEYYVVMEGTTSTAGFGGNGVTSYQRKVYAGNQSIAAYEIWNGDNSAVGASNYGVVTTYKVVKINGSAMSGATDAQGSGLGLAEFNNTPMTNLKLYWAWGSGYYETMKSLKYRIYRKEITPTAAPVITVSPTDQYHTGSSNSFSIAKPTYYANWQEQSYGVLQYRVAGGDWNNYTAASNISAEGSTKIEARLLTRGTLESPYGTAYSRLDRIKPGTPSIVGLDSTKWYRGTFNLTFTPGLEEGSGVNGVFYTLYGATEQARSKAATGGSAKSITADGQTIVTATTVDNVGWESDLISGKINIDNTPPVGVLTAPQGWTKSLSISVDGMDSASGFQFIRLPGNIAYNGSHYDYPVTQNGTYTFGFEDVAGNTSSKSITIANIDDVAPTVTVSRNGASWTDQDIPVTFKFTDAESGMNGNKLYYKWTQSKAEPSSWEQATSTQQTTTLSQVGVWYLHVKGYDLADNMVSFTSAAYQLQRQPETPQLSVIGTATDQMLLSWSLPAGDVNTDGLQYTIQNETTGKRWTLDYPVSELRDDKLAGGTTYSYTIIASNHVGSSLISSHVTGVTLPQATVSASVYASGEDYSRALLTVAPVQSATGYHIVATDWNTKQIDADLTVTGTTYQEVSGLKPYTVYDFSVRAVNDSGEGAAYHVSFLSLPDQPNGFKSVQMTENSIALGWNSVSRAVSVTEDTYYRLRRDNQSIFVGSVPSFTDTGLASGTAYDYDAAAGNATGWGTKATLHAWTLPAAPERLKQEKATPNSFTVSLHIPRGTQGFEATIDGTKVIRLGSVLSEYTFTGFQPGTSHTLEIAAYNQSGVGRSISMVGTTLPDLPASGAIAVADVQENSVTFEVYTVPGASKYNIAINGTSYEVATGFTTVYGLQGGTTYEYSFAGGNAAGYGQSYQDRVLTLPAAPTAYEVTKHTPTSLTLTWSAVHGADSYEVRDMTGTLLTTVNTPAYQATGLQPGGSVTYQITAKNASGWGAASTYTFRTLPGFEDADTDYNQLVQVDKSGVHNVQISWKKVPGADEYRVYDAYGQLVVQTSERSAVIDQLQSATRYTGYTVVPVNSTGEGKAMPVPAAVTLPDGTIALSYDSTRSSITLHLKHSLTAETLVIAAQGQELYRGPVSGYADYMQDRLQADSTYSFTVWTENEQGDRSEPQTLQTKTKKEHVDVAASAPIAETTEPEVTEEPEVTDPAPVDQEESETSSKTGFIDIDRSFAKASITRLADLGVVQGVSEELYAPQSGTTRAEFMAMLTRLTLTHEQIDRAADQDLTFADVDATGWYMPELRAAITYGIAKGFDVDTFAPDQEIDREQAAKMLSGALYSLVPETNQDYYADAATVSPWAKSEVNGLTATNIVQGYPDQTFRPHANLTRAESAAMIDRAMQGGMIEEPQQ